MTDRRRLKGKRARLRGVLPQIERQRSFEAGTEPARCTPFADAHALVGLLFPLMLRRLPRK